jgi:hypothetical protein
VKRNEALEAALEAELSIDLKKRSIRERAVDAVWRRQEEVIPATIIDGIEETIAGAARAITSIEDMELERA